MTDADQDAEVRAAHAHTTEDAARWAAMNAYVAEVDRVANDPGLPRVLVVVCAECGRDRRGRLEPVAEVLSPTPLGPVLVTGQPTAYTDRDTAQPITRGQAHARGARTTLPRAGWVVDGPHTWAARVGPWTHPAGRHAPEVRCPAHGALVPSVDGLRAALRSGVRRVSVDLSGVVGPA